MPSEFIPKHPVIAAYPKVPQAFTEAEAMSHYLKEKGIDAPFGSLYDEDLRKRVNPILDVQNQTAILAVEFIRSALGSRIWSG